MALEVQRFFIYHNARANVRKFSISFQGPKFCNSLSFEIEMQQVPLRFAVS